MPDARCSSPRNARLPKFYEHSTENDKGTGAALSSDGGDFLGPLSLSSAAPQIRLTGGVSREIGGGDLTHFLLLLQSAKLVDCTIAPLLLVRNIYLKPQAYPGIET